MSGAKIITSKEIANRINTVVSENTINIFLYRCRSESLLLMKKGKKTFIIGVIKPIIALLSFSAGVKIPTREKPPKKPSNIETIDCCIVCILLNINKLKLSLRRAIALFREIGCKLIPHSIIIEGIKVFMIPMIDMIIKAVSGEGYKGSKINNEIKPQTLIEISRIAGIARRSVPIKYQIGEKPIDIVNSIIKINEELGI